ncbi:MAG: hypothetical protein JW924_12335 [Fusobacteriaceae bacterium]|nr:hypothetical protein [Fusobacteriaceae bacterium]
MRKLRKKINLGIEEYKEKLKKMSDEELVKEFKGLADTTNPFDVKRRTDAILDEVNLRK